jgi:hypothetical protein
LDRENPAAQKASAVLRMLVERVAATGRLKLDIETAATMIHATGCGTTLTLIATPPAPS